MTAKLAWLNVVQRDTPRARIGHTERDGDPNGWVSNRQLPFRSVRRFPLIEGLTMNEDRIEGAATTLGGRVETNLGEVTGDRKLQSDGLIDQARGSAQSMFGGAQDALRSALD
jgi:uncharacterized protein YjbJ (UPF0337 family)